MTATPSPWQLAPELVFLNHGSFGSCPAPVLAHQSELRARMERDPMLFFLHDLEACFDEVRAALARLVGARAEEIALVSNATYAVNAVLASLALAAGDEILVTSHGYPAVTNAVRRWTAPAGARCVVADVPFPISDPEQVTESVLRHVTPATRLVIVDQVTSPTALIFPTASIVRACAERGVDVLVDGAHAPGMVPLALDQLGAAYFTGNLHKWVCAPKGAAFLHVRPDRIAGVRPLATSHGASSVRSDRSRFLLEFDWTGTADPTALLAVPRAIEFLSAQEPDGLPGVMRRNRELALAARELLASRLGLSLPCPDAMIGSIASLPLPDARLPHRLATYLEPLAMALYERHRIQVPIFSWPSEHSRLLRVSAQRYNRIEQYETLAAALREELARQG